MGRFRWTDKKTVQEIQHKSTTTKVMKYSFRKSISYSIRIMISITAEISVDLACSTPIWHGPNQQKSEKVWDLWYHIRSIRFHCPMFCFDRLILVNTSRCSSKHCLCLHHHLSTCNKIDKSVTQICPWHFYGIAVMARNLKFSGNIACGMTIPENSEKLETVAMETWKSWFATLGGYLTMGDLDIPIKLS